MAAGTGTPLLIQFRFLSGEETDPHEFLSTDPVYVLSLHVKRLKGIVGCESPQLVFNGSILPMGLALSSTALVGGCTVEVVFMAVGDLPLYDNRGSDVLPVRIWVDPASSLPVGASGGHLDLSGFTHLNAAIVVPLLSASLTSLDLRQCWMKLADMHAIFGAVPASVKELRASRNFLNSECLQALSAKGLQLRVLDVGYPDSSGMALVGISELVGEHTEELIVGDFDISAESLHLWDSILKRCPNLKKIDISWCKCRGSAFGTAVLQALSEHCPQLEVLAAAHCDCSPDAVIAVATKCTRLKVVALDCLNLPSVAVLAQLPNLEVAHLEMASAGALLLAAAELKVNQLHLGIHGPAEPDEQACCEDAPGGLQALGQRLAEALAKSTATTIGLSLPLDCPCLDIAVLRAVGPRLQSLTEVTWRSEGSTTTSMLSLLSQVPESCGSLRVLSISFWEQIDPGVLAVVAAACPNLEHLQLNADSHNFQKSPIDDGVAALGRHCLNLVYVDLYDRKMENAAAVLAQACKGWPKLRFLCAANTTQGLAWNEADPELILPRSLAAHCPDLREVVLYDDALASWRDVLKEGCPFLKDDEDD
mmetsp:Transcript_156240/g.501293  ORF Transcript_156240/g.501293 Transcript_156240/m.501293 type:complete len:593 (+) Transcript_156240:71-1849(+)